VKKASSADTPAGSGAPQKCNLIGYKNAGSLIAESSVRDHPTCNLIGYKSARLLWLWVGAGFLALALAWTAIFIAARQADVRTVPLATKGGRP